MERKPLIVSSKEVEYEEIYTRMPCNAHRKRILWSEVYDLIEKRHPLRQSPIKGSAHERAQEPGKHARAAQGVFF